MSRWRPEGQYDRPWLLLCEGESDRLFLNALIEARGIPRNFQVEHPCVGDNPGGNTGFGRRLQTLYDTSESFRDSIKAVLIVSDNDDDIAASFANVKNQLKIAKFPTPDHERIVARKKDYPSITIMMVPHDEQGNLETLCGDPAHQKWGLKAEVDALIAAAPANGWNIPKQSKMRIQTMLAATCRKAPDISFAQHWTLAQEFQIPLDHTRFDDIATFLSGFEALLAA